MTVTISPRIKRLIDAQIKAGRFDSPEDVIASAVLNLARDADFGEFAPGELNALIAEGERDIRNGDVFEAKQVFDELRRKSAQRRGRIK